MPVLVVAGVCQSSSRGGGWVPLLSDVSFDVERGEVVAIVGGRLAGKSTLLEIAAGVAVPEAGSVRFDGVELTCMSERQRVRLRGREIVWLSRAGMSQRLKVVKIVGWPLAFRRGCKAAERRAAQMLERVGALDCAHQRWPDLSPWDQLLVGLAQAFTGVPKLVVVDDLLDGLGSHATLEASRLLRSLIAETAPATGVLMSASDRDSAVFADRVWSLGRGGKLTPTTGHSRSQADVLPLRPRDARSR